MKSIKKILSLFAFVLVVGKVLAQPGDDDPPPPGCAGSPAGCPDTTNIDFIVPLLLAAAVAFIVFYVYRMNKRVRTV
jgi:hypothetical protein